MKKNLLLLILLFVFVFLGGCSTKELNDNFSKKIDCANIYYSYYLDRLNDENEHDKEWGSMMDFDVSNIFTTKFYYDGDYGDDSVVYSYLLPLGFFYSPTEDTCILEMESNSHDSVFGFMKHYRLWDMLTDTVLSYYGIKFTKGSGWIDNIGNESDYKNCMEYLKGDASKKLYCRY